MGGRPGRTPCPTVPTPSPDAAVDRTPRAVSRSSPLKATIAALKPTMPKINHRDTVKVAAQHTATLPESRLENNIAESGLSWAKEEPMRTLTGAKMRNTAAKYNTAERRGILLKNALREGCVEWRLGIRGIAPSVAGHTTARS